MPYKSDEVLRKLKRAGFAEKRRAGSHSILKQAGIGEDEFKLL